MFSSMLYMENAEQRGTGIGNGSEWSKGTFHLDQAGPTEESGPCTSSGGPIFSKLFRLDWTDLFNFKPKFPDILVDWILPDT